MFFSKFSTTLYFYLISNETNRIFLYEEKERVLMYINRIKLKTRIKIYCIGILMNNKTKRIKMIKINKIVFFIKVFTENPQEFYHF